MASTPPKLVSIDHDDRHAKYVGRTSDGRQFFLTTPFEPGAREFIALYVFDGSGALLEAKLDELGPRATVDGKRAQDLCELRLRELGEVSFERIDVAPFAIERFGTTFGLVAREPEDDDDLWAVEAQPGDYMAFNEPWDSGEYDT